MKLIIMVYYHIEYLSEGLFCSIIENFTDKEHYILQNLIMDYLNTYLKIFHCYIISHHKPLEIKTAIFKPPS